MAVAHPTHGSGPDHRGGGPGWHFLEWTVGIIGGIGLFLGLVALLASDETSIGLGGDWSWEVGEISTGAKYGVLVGGLVLLGLATMMIVLGRRRPAPAAAVGSARSHLIWHAGIFLLVNAFLWVQDIANGDGLNYAHWTTIPWAIGLGVHALVFMREQHAPG